MFHVSLLDTYTEKLFGLKKHLQTNNLSVSVLVLNAICIRKLEAIVNTFG